MIDMLEWMVFLIGCIFVFFGASKTTCLKPLGDEINDYVSTFFFIYGLALIFVALFLFNSPIPFSLVNQENTSLTYYPQNVSTYSYDSVGAFQGWENRTVLVLNSSSKSFVYNVAGSEIVNGLSTFNFIILGLYMGLFSVSILKKVYDKTGKRFK